MEVDWNKLLVDILSCYLLFLSQKLDSWKEKIDFDRELCKPFYQIIISAYNLPRFFEVKVCKFTQCDNFSYILDPSHATNNSDNGLTNCFNVTDVVKTELRENNIYISVSGELH